MKTLATLLALCPLSVLLAQNLPDCESQKVRDSLFSVYRQQAHAFGIGDIRWKATYDTLIARCPNISEAYQERGLYYIVKGETDEVLKNMDRAVALEPRRWLAYRGYLHCMLAQNYEAAIRDFEMAEQMMPHAFTMDHSFSFFLAMAYLGKRDFDKAELYFNKDIETQHRGAGTNDIHYNTLLYFGIMYYQADELDKAAAKLRECLNLYQQHPTANYYMGLILKATGSPQQKIFFQNARQFMEDGYKINEPNSQLVPYPYQVTMADLNQF